MRRYGARLRFSALVVTLLCDVHPALAGAPEATETPAPGAAESKPETRTPAERADAHFRRGVELAASGDFTAAVSEFEAALELSPHPAVLYNLGQAYARSGRPVDAILAWRRYLEATPDMQPERRRTVEELIRTSEQRIGWLKIDVTPDEATVLVDGREAPRLEDGRFVLAAGNHRLLAYAKGHEVASHAVSVEAAVTTAFDVVLVPAMIPGAVLPADRVSPAQPARASEHAARAARAERPGDVSWLKVPLLAAGGALVLAGGITYLVNSGRHETLQEQKGAWAGRIPLEPDPEWTAEAARLDARQDELRTVDLLAVGLLSAGLAASVAGAAVWFAASTQESPTHPVAVKATFSRIEVSGRW